MNQPMRYLSGLFRIDDSKPELLTAQVRAYHRQIPLMYLVTLASSAALGVTFHDHAPMALTTVIPLLLAAVSVARLFIWRRARKKRITRERAVRSLRSVIRFAGILGIGFTAWALALFEYGDAYARMHVAYYMSITVISCIFCLMHVRQAALLLTAIVLVPFVVFFGLQDQLTFRLIAMNVALVTVAMIFVLVNNYRDFEALIDSRTGLIDKQRTLEHLHGEVSAIADMDSLTRLPNRRRFFADLTSAMTRVRDSGGRLTVGVIDLDGFKPVNDVYGHASGDRVLIEVALRLGDTAKGVATVARLGGDEFALIMAGRQSDADIRALGVDICMALRQPVRLDELKAQLSGSIGFASLSDTTATAEQLYESADYALYHAKRHARGTPVLFTSHHEVAIRENSEIEQVLRSADLEAELSLLFQPVIDVDTGAALSFEALARWSSPRLGSVAPSVFIPAAERTGNINQVTETLLKKALAEAASWPDNIRLSFNLSAHDITAPDTAERLGAIVDADPFPWARLDFEVTETAVMQDFDQADRTLSALKARGAAVALDDFGSGFSSLSYVHRLPLDKLKIDRNFMADIEAKSTSRNIIKSVVDLCETLGLDCIAEGTETPGQIAILRRLGCRRMQGYYFARPMRGEKLSDFMAGHARIRPAAL